LQVALTVGCLAIGVNTGLVDLKAEVAEIPGLKNFKIVNNFNEVVDSLILI